MTAPALWSRHRELAYTVAGDFYLPGAERQDVEQEALIALWIAARSYDAGHGVSFRSFASHVIRRRLATALKAALRAKHRPLTQSVRVLEREDGFVRIVEELPGGPDPAEVVVDREAFRRLVAAVGELTALEREGLLRAVNGERYRDEKRIDNAVQRARRKLREAA